MGKSTLRALILYWSAGGNTRKVAEAIGQALGRAGADVEVRQIAPDLDVDYGEWPLVFLGAPVYHYLPPKPVTEFLFAQQRSHGRIEPSAPERPGHFGVVFCTYGGPHTGLGEAVPALGYMGQFLEHDGIRVVDSWAVVGEFHEASQDRMNVEGRLGDIRGRPNEADLAEVRGRVDGLLRRIGQALPGAGGARP